MADTAASELAAVHEGWARAVAALLAAWGHILTGQISALALQIRGLITGGDIAGLANLQAPTDDAHATLLKVMAALAAAAGEHVNEQAQKAGVEAKPAPADEEALSKYAAVTVGLLGAELATSAGREAQRVLTPGARGSDEGGRVADLVTEHLNGLTDARQRQWLSAALTAAQHDGRAAAYRAVEADPRVRSVTYTADEVGDENTCSPCDDIDGRVIGASIDEALAVYPGGGYWACEGGVRCRGMYVADWEVDDRGGG